MWKLQVLTIMAALAICMGQNIARQECTADRMMNEVSLSAANVLIGGIFDIRDVGSNAIGCGRPHSDMMQVYEASVYAVNFLNNVNNGAGYINGVKFGMKAYDTCSSPNLALSALQMLYPQTTSSNPYCVTSNQVMAGIVGPLFSSSALPVAEMAGNIPVSVVSPSAMSPALSDKFKYPTFLRTVPSTAMFAKAVVELLQRLQWENVLVVYADDAYGHSGYEQLLQAAHRAGICVSAAIPVKSSNDKDGYKTELQAISSSSYSTAAVMIAGSAQTKRLLEAVDELPGAANVQWILSDLDISEPSSVNSYNRARGAIVVTPRSPTLDEFRDYFTNLEANPRNTNNPWFEDWYEDVNNCLLNTDPARGCPSRTLNGLRSEFVQHPFVVPTIKAVFAYAEVVRSICGNSGYCSQLRNMDPSTFHNQLKGLTFTFPNNFQISGLAGQRITFDANGDPEVSEYTVYSFNNRTGSYRFEEIGLFDTNGLTLNTNPTFYDSARNAILTPAPTARCQAVGCLTCLLPQRSVQFRYSGNDIVIASLVNGHDSDTGPFTCGDGMASRLASLVAAEWAVSQYKSRGTTISPYLGSLVADICPDSYVAGSFISDLLSGNNRLMDSMGSVISSSNIHAFVTQTESGQAEVLSPILSQYMIPEVQTSATTAMIGNNAMSPYFSRAIPNDEVFYTALSSLLLQLNWKYVQVATHSMGRFQHMTQTFIKKAAEHGICIVGVEDQLDHNAANRYEQALTHLNSRRNASIVVIIGDKEDVRGLLTAKQNLGLVNDVQFIAGTDRWARDPEYIQGLESAAAGSIVVDLELMANADFNSWLQSRTLTQIADNQFLGELFEITKQCSVYPSTRGVYSRICTNQDTGNNLDIYQGKASYMISSIYTVAEKLNEIVSELCPANTGLCSNFRTTKDIGMRLDEKLQYTAKSGGYGIQNGEGITNYKFYQYTQSVWSQIADFNTENKMLQNQNLPATNRRSECHDSCMECQYMFTMQNGFFMPGDWLIAGAFSVSTPGPEETQPYICGTGINTNGPQYTAAMLYALQQVNFGQAPVSVKGVKLGGLALDHCNADRRANLMVSNIFSGLNRNMGVDQSRILAWMPDTTITAHEAAELLDPLGVAMMSPAATGENLLNYPNFYRTVQGDETTALALIKIIKSLQYAYIQVAHSADSYGRGGLNTMMNIGQTEGICVTNSVELADITKAGDAVNALLQSDTDVVVLYMDRPGIRAILNAITLDTTARARFLILMPEPFPEIVNSVKGQITKEIISLQLVKFDLTGYNNYISRSPIDNPYFARYYMEIMNCNLPGYFIKSTSCSMPLRDITSNNNYNEDNFVLATINSVYSIVDALDRTLKDYCGADYQQPCAEFMAATDKRSRFNRYLNSVTFLDESQQNFRFLAREGNTAFQVLQSSATSNEAYEVVGTYRGVSLDLTLKTTNYASVESTCRAPCLSCIMRGLSFTHTAGDIYLAGLFDVHARSLSPFTCGDIQTLHGFLLVEAFHYALERVNSKEGQFANILPGTRLGGVGLDACASAIRGGYLVSNINNGVFNLSKDGLVVNPMEIDTYIGSYTSTSSLYLARILTELEIPQISYASSSRDLDDTRIYPYFFRTVPSDDKQVEAMLKLLDRLNISYVQVLYEDNSFGSTAKDTFIAEASKYRICVAQTVPYTGIGVVSAENANDVISRLLAKPAADTVVTFLGTAYINSLLQAVKGSGRAERKLRFVGSDAWGDNQDAIYKAADEAVGSITLKLDSDDVEDFEGYINSRTLANSIDNPWFEEYYQEIHNCYTSRTNNLKYPSQCPTSPLSNINSQGYQQDPGVVYVINAVYAAAYGIHETLKAKCGEDYSAVCQAYRRQPDRHMVLRDKLEDVKFTDIVGNPFMFVNRSGVAGYRFNNIEEGTFSYIYKEFGSYDAVNHSITLMSYPPQRDSGCERVDACAECPAIRDAGVRYTFLKPTGKSGAPVIVAFFDIHEQGVDPYRCGKLNIAGFQQFLSFFYAMENMKEKFGLDRNSIRVLAIDTCSNSLRVDQDLYGLLDGTGLCNTAFSGDQISAANIGSVITLGNLNTMAAARVLEALSITYISPNALSTHLDDKNHLVRTISPISGMMKYLADMLRTKGWSYVDVVYENSAHGIYPWQSLSYYALPSSSQKRVCLASKSADADEDQILDDLHYSIGSRAVILLGSHAFVKSVLMQANDLGIIEDYIWVLGMQWDLTQETVNTLVPVGSSYRIMSLSPIRDNIQSFDTYVNGLTRQAIGNSNSQYSIPESWFDEFYEAVFECSIEDSRGCDLSKTLGEGSWAQDKYVLNTVAAAYAAVSGLSGVTSNQQLDRSLIREQILNVVWDMKDHTVKKESLVLNFDKERRWWPHGYDVHSWPSDSPDTWGNVVSQCTQTVAAGACGCLDDVIAVVPKASEQTDSENDLGTHRNYYKYNSENEQTYDWPIWAIVVAVFTVAGLVIVIILFLILLFAYPKKGGTSILGYLSIIGIMGIYAINFAFFVHATDATCGIRRFLMGVIYMVALAPLLIKAIDNWRFGDWEYDQKEKYSGLSSALVLLLSALGIVLVQCIIPIIWLILVHPTYSFIPTNGFHDNNWCDPVDDYDLGLVLSFVFVIFILLVTSIFCAMAFDTPRNNYESRWILFGCIATAGCFLVWMIVSTNAGAPYRDPSVAIGNFVNATLLMIVLPLRKTILLFRARRENEENKLAAEMMNGRGGVPYGEYDNSFMNPSFELTDYDNYDSKPSEF